MKQVVKILCFMILLQGCGLKPFVKDKHHDELEKVDATLEELEVPVPDIPHPDELSKLNSNKLADFKSLPIPGDIIIMGPSEHNGIRLEYIADENNIVLGYRTASDIKLTGIPCARLLLIPENSEILCELFQGDLDSK